MQKLLKTVLKGQSKLIGTLRWAPEYTGAALPPSLSPPPLSPPPPFPPPGLCPSSNLQVAPSCPDVVLHNTACHDTDLPGLHELDGQSDIWTWKRS